MSSSPALEVSPLSTSMYSVNTVSVHVDATFYSVERYYIQYITCVIVIRFLGTVVTSGGEVISHERCARDVIRPLLAVYNAVTRQYVKS